jgi:predicted nucleic acid-binding protein
VNVFFDTNVVLDVLTERHPFYRDSAAAWALAEQARVQGLVSAVSMTTLYYVVRKRASRAAALEMLRTVRRCVAFAPCDGAVIGLAVDGEFEDFEDGVQYFSARASRADVFLTRNSADFPADGLPVMSPAEFLASRSYQ